MKKRAHLFISGRVQGVTFRMEMKLRAGCLRVSGFVKNLQDGRVEALIEGEEKKVGKLIDWARRGPAFARVTDIQIVEEAYEGEFSEFKIIY